MPGKVLPRAAPVWLANLGVVHALVEALIARGTLLGDEINDIIFATLSTHPRD